MTTVSDRLANILTHTDFAAEHLQVTLVGRGHAVTVIAGVHSLMVCRGPLYVGRITYEEIAQSGITAAAERLIAEWTPRVPTQIARTPLDSRVIKSVGFQITQGSRGTLVLEFVRSGRVYAYDDVPQGMYDDLMDGRSVGEFFTRSIKPFFTGREVTDAG